MNSRAGTKLKNVLRRRMKFPNQPCHVFSFRLVVFVPVEQIVIAGVVSKDRWIVLCMVF
ncbi:MAG: hypothetical protein BWX55_00707 [Deltaproteobacteria bacterium ADurb.Bin022]|nr:MAG: hypothetical protein BWX55_00707 [Deltaproteobacteria bacterium ADurb.Bin022]